MKSLKLDENGDILFNAFGKLELIDNLDKLKQSILLKLKTEKGELFYNDEYGFDKIRGKITKEIFLDYIKLALLEDERINNIELINFDITKIGEISAGILIKLNTNEILDLNIII